MFTEKLSPEELALLTNIIAIEICKGKTTDEITMLATIYSSIAGQMILIATQRDYIDDKKTATTENTSVVSTESVNRKSKNKN